MPAKKRKSDAKDDEATGASTAATAAPAASAAASAAASEAAVGSAIAAHQSKYKPNSPCHIELPAHDVRRAAKFYTDALGWKCTPYGPDYMCWATDGLGGGFFHTTAPIGGGGVAKAPVISTYSTDVPATLARIDAAGGVVTKCNTLITKEIGAMALYRDTEGTEMSVYTERTDDLVATQDVDQRVQLALSAHDAYETFLDAKKHAAFTPGNACSIDRRPGGAFSVSCGFITGRLIAFDADKQITQSWRAQDWPAGHWSHLTLTFAPLAGGDAKSCTVHVQQTGVPLTKFDEISKGWFEYYWKHMHFVKDLTTRQYVYRPCGREQYEKCKAMGKMPGCDEETKAGAIFLFTPTQTRASAAKHFAGNNDFHLMKISVAKLGFAFRWEPAKDKDAAAKDAEPTGKYMKPAGADGDVAVPMTAVEDCIHCPWDAAKKVHVYPPTIF